MNWIFKIFTKSQAVRIRPGHLPGLRPPTAAPFKPKMAKEEVDLTGEAIKAAYKRFKASPASKKNRQKNEKGLDF